MPNELSESPNIQLVEKILEGLANVRIARKGWFDSEEEATEQESLAFKIGETLRCFLIARQVYPDRFVSFPLDEKIILYDISEVLTSVRKKGFYPSPYSPIPNVNDQYTDFAAFCLDFCDLVYNYSLYKNKKNLQSLSQNVAKQALSLLINPRNFLNDAEGSRWAGTTMFARETKVREYYTDTYFTSVVITALRKVLERPVLGLSDREKDNIRRLIRNAGQWIVLRSDNGLLTGDEKKSIKKLIYSTWGLRALTETYDTQAEDIRKLMPSIIVTYLKEVKEKLNREGVSLGQEYFTILSPSVETPLYYEDRSDWGGIFLTLVSFRKLPEIDSLLEDAGYKQILDSVYNGLLLLRDPFTKLWYRDKLILSIHSYLTEGFLLYERQAKDFGTVLNITSGMLRKAIKDTLTDDSVLTTLQQVVYNKLLRTAEKTAQDKVIDQGIEEAAKEIHRVRDRSKSDIRYSKVSRRRSK